MKKLHIEACQATSVIYAGHKRLNGAWAAGKQDVTVDALSAVVDHVNSSTDPVYAPSQDGMHMYEITVKRI